MISTFAALVGTSGFSLLLNPNKLLGQCNIYSHEKSGTAAGRSRAMFGSHTRPKACFSCSQTLWCQVCSPAYTRSAAAALTDKASTHMLGSPFISTLPGWGQLGSPSSQDVAPLRMMTDPHELDLSSSHMVANTFEFSGFLPPLLMLGSPALPHVALQLQKWSQSHKLLSQTPL